MSLVAHEAGAQFTGYLTGLFWTLFGLAGLFGNIISVCIYWAGSTTERLLWILVGIGMAAAFDSCLIVGNVSPKFVCERCFIRV